MNQYPRFPIIGTPLSNNAIRVMMLGSGELGKEVIIELQRLGIEVIALGAKVDSFLIASPIIL